MKLKKIASLMLAGIMAVSMLAACGEGTGNNGGASSSEPTTTTGYSALLEDNLGKTVTDKNYVTFADNADDAAALSDALKNVSNQGVNITLIENHNLVNLNTWNTHGFEEMIESFMDDADFTDADIKEGDLAMTWYAGSDYANHKVKDGTLYAISGSVGEAEAIERVAARVEQYLAQLPAHDTVVNGTDVWDYNYVVSVSLVNKPVSNITWYTDSVNFIAVTVTRVPTAA